MWEWGECGFYSTFALSPFTVGKKSKRAVLARAHPHDALALFVPGNYGRVSFKVLCLICGLAERVDGGASPLDGFGVTGREEHRPVALYKTRAYRKRNAADAGLRTPPRVKTCKI